MTGALHRHRVFLAILATGLLVRAAAVLGYPPALWYPDSFPYVGAAMRPYPTVVRPAGYPLLLLWPLRGLHSFAAVTIVQHLLGLAAGIIMYALLRRRGIRPWVAALASAPVLLSAYEIQIEHFIMSDSLFIFLVVVALAALLWNGSPGWLSCVVAGLLLAATAVTRTDGLPLIIAPVIWLLVRPGISWWGRLAKVTLFCVAYSVPVISYATWFHEVHGQYKLTYGTGAFLAARAESFTRCVPGSVPVAERWLCATTPGRKPDWYLWASGAPLPHAKSGEFSSATDHLGTDFAIRMFEMQPGGYVLSVWRAFLQNFSSGGSAYSDGQVSFAFPEKAPATIAQLAITAPGDPRPIYRYAAGHDPSTRIVQPWASALSVYQQIVVFPPTVVGLITLMACGGIILAWKRRGGPALLPWAIGVVLLAFPAATSGFGARYELAGVAPFCLAAALGLMEIRGHSPEPAVEYRRSERWARVAEYVPGLVAGREQSNGWRLAERAAEAGPDGMQRLLRRDRGMVQQGRRVPAGPPDPRQLRPPLAEGYGPGRPDRAPPQPAAPVRRVRQPADARLAEFPPRHRDVPARYGSFTLDEPPPPPAWRAPAARGRTSSAPPPASQGSRQRRR